MILSDLEIGFPEFIYRLFALLQGGFDGAEKFLIAGKRSPDEDASHGIPDRR